MKMPNGVGVGVRMGWIYMRWINNKYRKNS